MKLKTPYEALTGDKPDLSHLVAIGTKVFVHTTKKKIKKMDFRGTEGRMVGYGGRGIYRIWNTMDNKILMSSSVEFVSEMHETSGSKEGEKPIYDEIVVMPEPRKLQRRRILKARMAKRTMRTRKRLRKSISTMMNWQRQHQGTSIPAS